MENLNVVTDDDANEVPTLNRAAGHIDDVCWDIYWNQVRDAVRDVFGGDFDKVEAVKSRVESQGRDFRSSFYHLDPFQVAADIADAAEITAEQKARYGNMLKNIGGAYKRDLLQQVGPNQTAMIVPDDTAIHDSPGQLG